MPKVSKRLSESGVKMPLIYARELIIQEALQLGGFAVSLEYGGSSFCGSMKRTYTLTKRCPLLNSSSTV